jgi:hypothetical protein
MASETKEPTMPESDRRPKHPSPPAMRRRASQAIASTILAGIDDYQRQRCLPALVPMLPSEIADPGETMRRRIVGRLARALRAERRRGRAGHWSYDINRHIALVQAYEAERRMLPARRGSMPAANEKGPGECRAP